MLSAEEQKRWFEGKEFTRNFVSGNLSSWLHVLKPLRDCAPSVLECGTFEGRSAVVFLEYLPNSTITTVDTFSDSAVEDRFDRNMRGYGDRVTKIKNRAVHGLEDLFAVGEQFDLIYIDAGKSRANTFAQSALAWAMLKTGGILIWDDLEWQSDKPESERPEGAIRLFCHSFRGCLEIQYSGYQMIVRKTAEWPRLTLSQRMQKARRLVIRALSRVRRALRTKDVLATEARRRPLY